MQSHFSCSRQNEAIGSSNDLKAPITISSRAIQLLQYNVIRVCYGFIAQFHKQL